MQDTEPTLIPGGSPRRREGASCCSPGWLWRLQAPAAGLLRQLQTPLGAGRPSGLETMGLPGARHLGWEKVTGLRTSGSFDRISHREPGPLSDKRRQAGRGDRLPTQSSLYAKGPGGSVMAAARESGLSWPASLPSPLWPCRQPLLRQAHHPQLHGIQCLPCGLAILLFKVPAREQKATELYWRTQGP